MRSVRRLLISALGLGLLAAPAVAQTPAPPVPVTGPIIMDGAWDLPAQKSRGGLPAQWLGLQVRPAKALCFTLGCARYALKVVTNPVRDGTKAGRFVVQDGDNPFGDAERAEVQGKVTGPAGSIRWYTWSTYLPPSFPFAQANDNRWLAFTQWAVNKGSAPISMTVHEGQVVLQVNDQVSATRGLAMQRPWGTPIAPHRGRWLDFAMFVKWSPRGNGQIQLWVNGVQQQMNWPFSGEDPARFGGVGSYTYNGKTLVPGGGSSYVRQGIVRAKAFQGRTTIVHDALKVHAAAAVPVPPVTPLPAPTLPAPTPPAPAA